MKAKIRDVKTHLSEFGDLANSGETIVVTKNGKPWFDMVPHRKACRSVKPLQGVKPIIDPEAATTPVNKADLAGWT